MAKIVCVFAHPDDEAFGPGGTIAKLSPKNEISLICVTDGNAKGGPRSLGEIRKKELAASCKVLGIKKLIFLGYGDGSLNLNLYHELADKIRTLLTQIKPESVITFELRGLTGHPDHFVVSGATTFVAQKLPFVKSILYFCMDDKTRLFFGEYFIHCPPGYSAKEINKTVDIKDVWEKKVAAINCHSSQGGDIKRALRMYQALPKKEYFIEVKNNR